MPYPNRFGKYILLEKLGSGGMAELFLAKQTGLKGFEKAVAIKRILPHLTENPEFVSMFINEAKLAALLTHQNIVQIFDLGNVDQAYYISMEYIMGKDLRTLGKEARERKLPLSIGNILLIISRICSALDYAHRKKTLSGRDLNIVHRDISPQNILVSYEGEIKLVDFGIAKAATGAQETQAGVLKGKLAYMSPEQAWGKGIDKRSDIFALGIVLYEMITETRLFKGNDEISVLERVRAAEIPSPSKLNPEVPPELVQVVFKALAKDVDVRYQSASEMQQDLEKLIGQKGYSFSSLSLANSLQVIYQEEIEREAKRLELISTQSDTVAPEEKPTVIRPRAKEIEVAPPPIAPLQSSKRRLSYVSKPAPVSRVTKTIAFSIFLLAGLTLLFQLLLSDLPEIVRARRTIPALQFFHDYARGYLEKKGVMDSLTLLKINIATLIGAETPQPIPHASPTGDIGLTSPESPVARKELEMPPLHTVVNALPRRPDRLDFRQRREKIKQLFSEARKSHNAGKASETERILREIIDVGPNTRRAYHLLGTVFLERGDIDGALRIYSDASLRFPDDPLLHFDVGAIYFKKGVTSLAVQELTKSIQKTAHAPYANRARQMLGSLGVSVKEPSAFPPSQTIEEPRPRGARTLRPRKTKGPSFLSRSLTPP